MAAMLFTKISTGGEGMDRSVSSRASYEWIVQKNHTKRLLAVVTIVFTTTLELSPPRVSSIALIRTVIGSVMQLLMSRFTEMGNVAEQSYVEGMR